MSPRILRKPWQFKRVYRDGKKLDCKYAVVFYYRTEAESEGPVFGCVASKRVGGAVKRSRAKRLLREAARQTAPLFGADDCWVVLVARAAVLDVTSDDLAAEVEKALRDEGLIH
jgi:ribonuclease P protein component